MSGRAHPEVLRRALEIRTRREAGQQNLEISRDLGLPVALVESTYARYKERDIEGMLAAIGQQMATPIAVPDKTDSFRKALEGLEPITLPPPPRPKRTHTPERAVVVAGDFHFPLADPRCEDILLQVIADLKPRAVVLNGDLPDMLAVSKYPSDLRKTWPLLEERVAMHRFLKQLHDTTAGWACDIVETDANHSGDGLGSRWWRYLSNRLGELASLPDIAERLSYQAVWWPSWAQMRLVSRYEDVPGFVVLHGTLARKQAGYSANAHLGKWRGSLLHNHTHRMGMTANRLPEFGGRPESDWAAYENGCMCRLDCLYDEAPDWQQGFAVIRHDDEGHYNVEQVRIRNGVAIVGGLGGRYQAAA